MKLLLKRAVFISALLILSQGCSQLKSSTPAQQKPQENQKIIPSLFQLKCISILNPDTQSITLTAETQVFTTQEFSTEKSRI
jgi:hypothetical protein